MLDALDDAKMRSTPVDGTGDPARASGHASEVFVDERVRLAARRLFEAADAIAVVLFGSRGRGTAHRWSDWDLCVILKDDAPVEDLTPFRLRPLTSDIGIPIDVVTIRHAVFTACVGRHGSLSQEVARDGKVILGHLELA